LMQMAEEEKKGQVKDLVEKLQARELTPEEVKREMKRRKLEHHAGEPIPGVFAVSGIVIWGILCFLPVICMLLNVSIVLPSMEMPLRVVYITFFFALAMSPLLFSAHERRAKGGTHDGDYTIILVKDGAHGIVRHPSSLGGLAWLVVLPILLNRVVNLPFTVLSIFGEVAVVMGIYLQCKKEERFNLRKWGDGYRRYQREVPMFNFILGIWRRARKKKKVM